MKVIKINEKFCGRILCINCQARCLKELDHDKNLCSFKNFTRLCERCITLPLDRAKNRGRV